MCRRAASGGWFTRVAGFPARGHGRLPFRQPRGPQGASANAAADVRVRSDSASRAQRLLAPFAGHVPRGARPAARHTPSRPGTPGSAQEPERAASTACMAMCSCKCTPCPLSAHTTSLNAVNKRMHGCPSIPNSSIHFPNYLLCFSMGFQASRRDF